MHIHQSGRKVRLSINTKKTLQMSLKPGDVGKVICPGAGFHTVHVQFGEKIIELWSDEVTDLENQLSGSGR